MRESTRVAMGVRPLTKGMFRDRASQMIEPGGFRTLRNVIVDPMGIRRRPAFVNFPHDAQFGETYGGRAVGIAVTWRNINEQVTILVTDKYLYELQNWDGYTLIPEHDATDVIETQTDWASTDGVTWTTVSGAFIRTDNDFNPVAPGDILEIDGLGRGTVKTVTSATQLSVDPPIAAVGAPYTDRTGRVHRSFRLTGDIRQLPDWAYAYGTVYFASLDNYVRELYRDGTNWEIRQLGLSSTPSEIIDHRWSAGAIGFYNERMFYGHTVEWDGASMEEYRQRVRFSVAGNPANVPVSNFIDLDYKPGKIQRIMGMGNLLVVYMEDTVFFGQPTNIRNLPVQFDEVESGGIGLVGQRAVVPYKDGHFFVGNDNIYYISTRGMEPIGTPILRESLRRCGEPWRIIASLDPLRNRVMFAFPTEIGDSAQNVWNFNYLTNAWSYEDYTTDMIASGYLNRSETIDNLDQRQVDLDIVGTTAEAEINLLDGISSTIDGLGNEDIEFYTLLRELGGRLEYASTEVGEDDSLGPITVVLESADHDFGEMDRIKRWSRLAVKLQFRNNIPLTFPLDFNVETSNNRGVTWKGVGILRVKAGMDEGHCDFRVTSPHLQFRMTSGSTVIPYWITEYTMTLVGSGNEATLGTQE